MNHGKKPKKKWRTLAVGLAVIIVLFAGFQLFNEDKKSRISDLHKYDYRDTRQLVALTARAAARVEDKGEQAFEDFRKNFSNWSLDGNSYLYVYDMDGVNLFHGGYPELKGKNLMELTDLDGKKPVNIIINQLEHHGNVNPHGWIHYLWVPPGAIDPVWKSSCNFNATMPDGREVFVGSGIDNPLQEREFYRIIVDEAVELLKRDGRAGLEELKSPESHFSIHDRGVFVTKRDGTAIIDPGMNLDIPRNLFDYKDPSGRKPLLELSKQLLTSEEGWVIMIHRMKKGSKPIKKGIYGRRVKVDGEDLIVGAICPLPHPAWMR